MSFYSLLRIPIDEKRIYGLDILRAIAILAVVWAHSAHYVPASIRSEYSLLALDGVSVFFVLSGFLIGSILIKLLEKGPVNLPALMNFWSRRWLRTLPAYFLVLITLIVISIRYVPGFSPSAVKDYFLFLQNFSSPNPSFFGEAWSLAVEEWFYLITPALLFSAVGLFRLKPKYSILVVALIILIMSTGLRYYRFVELSPLSADSWDAIFRKQVVTRLDSLMFGVIGAYVAFYYRNIWVKYKKPLLFAGIVLMLFPLYLVANPLGVFMSVFSFSIFSLGTLCTLPFLSEFKHGKGVVFRCVTHISLISYSMYLTNYTLVRHFMIDDFIQVHIYKYFNADMMAVSYVLFWTLTLLISTLIYKYFEVPFMNVRDRKKSARAIRPRFSIPAFKFKAPHPRRPV